MEAELHATVASRLRAVGQRYTSSRRALVEVIADAGRPLTIPEILARRSELPQSSVYRNLAVLEQAGTVHRLMAADEFARYELTEDLTEHHHHLMCVSCGNVADYTMSPTLERTMAKAIAEVAADTGFQPTGHRLDLVGLCRLCS
jgi:Fur family ferric uptake transcriptional regulator